MTIILVINPKRILDMLSAEVKEENIAEIK